MGQKDKSAPHQNVACAKGDIAKNLKFALRTKKAQLIPVWTRVQPPSSPPIVSVEKSFGFSSDFYYFSDIFAHFDQIKDFEDENSLYKVFIFIEKHLTH